VIQLRRAQHAFQLNARAIASGCAVYGSNNPANFAHHIYRLLWVEKGTGPYIGTLAPFVEV